MIETNPIPAVTLIANELYSEWTERFPDHGEPEAQATVRYAIAVAKQYHGEQCLQIADALQAMADKGESIPKNIKQLIMED